MIRVLICFGMSAARMTELLISRRNLARHPVRREGPWTRATYVPIVLVHAWIIARTVLRGRRQPSWGWLTVLFLLQPIRLWVLVLLGDRWNARAAVPVQMRIETRGPYRLVRHPNYTVVVGELLALPMAFGLSKLAVVAGLANMALLAGRIREEEAALSELAEYRDAFERKPRFLPWLF